VYYNDQTKQSSYVGFEMIIFDRNTTEDDQLTQINLNVLNSEPNKSL